MALLLCVAWFGCPSNLFRCLSIKWLLACWQADYMEQFRQFKEARSIAGRPGFAGGASRVSHL